MQPSAVSTAYNHLHILHLVTMAHMLQIILSSKGTKRKKPTLHCDLKVPGCSVVSFLPRFPCSSGWRGDGGGKCSSRTVQYGVTTRWKVRILSAYFLSDNVYVKWQEVCFLAFNPKHVIHKCSVIVSRIILTTQTHVLMPLFLQFKVHEFVSKTMCLKVPYYTYFQIFIFPPGF